VLQAGVTSTPWQLQQHTRLGTVPANWCLALLLLLAIRVQRLVLLLLPRVAEMRRVWRLQSGCAS
jgi:hypothetical protein